MRNLNTMLLEEEYRQRNRRWLKWKHLVKEMLATIAFVFLLAEILFGFPFVF